MVQPLRRRLLLHAFQAADLGVMTLAFAVSLIFVANTLPGHPTEILEQRVQIANLLLFMGFGSIWHLCFRFTGLYRSRRIVPESSEWWEIAKAVSFGTLVLGTMSLVFRFEIVDQKFLGAFFLVSLVGTIIMRSALRILLIGMRHYERNMRRVAIIGAGPRGAWFGRQIRQRTELGYLLEGYIDDIPPPSNPLHGGAEKHLGRLNQVEELVANGNFDELFIALPVRSYYETIEKVISLAETRGLTIRMPADSFKLHLSRGYLDYLGTNALLTLRTPAPGGIKLLAKRTMDVSVAGVAILATLPLMLLTAIAIKLDSRGPVLFVQDRVGRGGRLFKMLKFRTMVVDAEARLAALETENEVDGAAFKMRNDPRITRLGRTLRKYSVDELPQLFNVLLGDLSLVGPRPLPVRDVQRMSAEWQKRRFSVRPGLTCLWQIHGRHEIGFEHWMELDLQYIDNWSLGLDFSILMKTVPAVLRGAGSS